MSVPFLFYRPHSLLLVLSLIIPPFSFTLFSRVSFPRTRPATRGRAFKMFMLLFPKLPLTGPCPSFSFSFREFREVICGSNHKPLTSALVPLLSVNDSYDQRIIYTTPCFLVLFPQSPCNPRLRLPTRALQFNPQTNASFFLPRWSSPGLSAPPLPVPQFPVTKGVYLLCPLADVPAGVRIFPGRSSESPEKQASPKIPFYTSPSAFPSPDSTIPFISPSTVRQRLYRAQVPNSNF